ncbi:DNA polymerase IV [Neolewinella lacunae]|uniref:DNA polymerase IV n=1 Tax=Neolewinella lacunae TaxID=1517758 RepID=A0A923PK08_9BACT|nr:DNA polymerase IV [Neolewinella lacunae]MBC6995543.1 DNA polymerase IV [Neolewinella lacunae]MDN3635579.1 DNA polymerase IV [Neolewinella lacunae]
MKWKRKANRLPPASERKIIHIDMDAFFASVEQRDNPELRGKPIAVGGSKMRGVVAAASYEARVFGVRSAMPSVTAQRLCPQLIFVRGNFDRYREVSDQIRDIFISYTDLVEPLSLDEAYLDVTEPKRGPASATLIAQAIRREIFERTQLTASAGVSFNKFLAKVASDINKPNGMKVITRAEAPAFLAALPVKDFHGVGQKTATRLEKMGFKTGKDLLVLSELEMAQRFGKMGHHLYRIVHALDNRPVNPHRIRKSIGAERTYFEDVSSRQEMREKLDWLAEKIFRYLKKQNNFGRTVTLKMKTPDFVVHTRSRSFAGEIRTLPDLRATAYALLDENIDEVPTVRLLGLSISNLEREGAGGVQLLLPFDEEE